MELLAKHYNENGQGSGVLKAAFMQSTTTHLYGFSGV